MKKILFILLAMSLGSSVTGCSTAWPESASINPIINDQADNILPNNTRVTVTGNDTRTGTQIIKIKLDGKPVVLIPNNVAPSTLLAERLARGFAKQGAIITSNADNQLTLTITQLQAEVTKPGFVYKSRINVKVSLKAENNGAHITKEYRQSAMQESATLPNTNEIEDMLNIQLSKLLNQILKDPQIRGYIKSGI